MNSSAQEKFQDENTGVSLSDKNRFLNVSPGGGNSVASPQKSPFGKKSILKPSTKDNIGPQIAADNSDKAQG